MPAVHSAPPHGEGTQAPEGGANQGMGYTGSRRGANQGMSDEEEGEVLIPGRTTEGSLEEAAMKDAKNAEKGRGTLQSIWMACQSRTPGAERLATSTLSRRRAAAPPPPPPGCSEGPSERSFQPKPDYGPLRSGQRREGGAS